MLSPTVVTILKSAAAGAAVGFVAGNPKAGAGVGALYGAWMVRADLPGMGAGTGRKSKGSRSRTDQLMRSVQARLRAVGVDAGDIAVRGGRVVVSVPGALASTVHSALRDVMRPAGVASAPGDNDVELHFDTPALPLQDTVDTQEPGFDAGAILGGLGAPAFYVPGAGAGSQSGMWSYMRPGF